MSNVMFTNAVYFPNYRIYQGDTPGMLNYSCINHVYYAYASVSADGGVFVSSIHDLFQTSRQSGVLTQNLNLAK
jgi:GH18 family chitinase